MSEPIIKNAVSVEIGPLRPRFYVKPDPKHINQVHVFDRDKNHKMPRMNTTNPDTTGRDVSA